MFPRDDNLSSISGNLAHTKGKAMGTMRNQRTPQRTINFAKVWSLC